MTIYGKHVPGSKSWWVRNLQRHIQDNQIRRFAAADVARWLASHKLTNDFGSNIHDEMASRILSGGGEGSWRCDRPGQFAGWVVLPWEVTPCKSISS